MKLTKVLAAFAAAATSVSAQTITDIAVGDDTLTVLTDFVVSAKLDTLLSGSTNYTVFAPSDDAFVALDQSLDTVDLVAALKKDYNEDLLTSILSHHTLQGRKEAAAFASGSGDPTPSTLNGEDLTIDTSALTVTSAGGVQATLTEVNIGADNGVIHKVDAVLVPSGTPQFQTVAAVASGVLLEAVLAIDGLAGTLSALTDDGFTILAPTDQAFVNALEALGLTKEELLADKATLETILKYHVVPTFALSGTVGQAAAAGASLDTVQGEKIAVSQSGEDILLNGNAKVTAVDVRAYNGVVHVIDAVLLPPSISGDGEPDDSAASVAPVNVLVAAVSACVLAALA